MSDRAPAYRDPLLHFDALRLVALCEGDWIKDAPATENEGKCLCAHLRTCTQPAQLFAAGAILQFTPSPLRGALCLSSLLFMPLQRRHCV